MNTLFSVFKLYRHSTSSSSSRSEKFLGVHAPDPGLQQKYIVFVYDTLMQVVSSAVVAAKACFFLVLSSNRLLHKYFLQTTIDNFEKIVFDIL